MIISFQNNTFKDIDQITLVRNVWSVKVDDAYEILNACGIIFHFRLSCTSILAIYCTLHNMFSKEQQLYMIFFKCIYNFALNIQSDHQSHVS